jgi:Dullard-like phosphatase family protein
MDIEDGPKKKLLLIDLDETLIHSEFRNKDNYKALDAYTRSSKCKSKTFSYSDENYIYYIDVFFRPHLNDFLNAVSKYFDLAIFTAAMKGYADTILDYIDPNNQFFQFRLYRDACIPIQQRLYIKDLRIIKDYDPMNVILMDNSLYSFMNQPSNGMLVNSFYTNHKDTQLISAKNFLINHIFPCNDIRKECEKWYHFTDLFYKGTSKEKKEKK